MRATYEAIDIIYDLLTSAQDPGNGLPFSVDASFSIYDFQPGDFTVDGQPTEDGIYIFFDRTKFDLSQRSGLNQSHDSLIAIDLYTSINSTRSTGTGDIEHSVRRADRSIRAMANDIYDAISHSEFHRLFNERITADTWRNGGIYISEVMKTGVLRLKNSKNTIAHQRMICMCTVTEIHDTNQGSALTSVRDLIEPVRVDDES